MGLLRGPAGASSLATYQAERKKVETPSLDKGKHHGFRYRSASSTYHLKRKSGSGSPDLETYRRLPSNSTISISDQRSEDLGYSHHCQSTSGEPIAACNDYLVRASLLAIAVDQSTLSWLTGRYREQARSHRYRARLRCSPARSPSPTPPTPTGPALSPRVPRPAPPPVPTRTAARRRSSTGCRACRSAGCLAPAAR